LRNFADWVINRMVVVAVFALNIADPGRSLTRAQDLAGSPPIEEEGGKF